MTDCSKVSDKNVDGILTLLQDYLLVRERQAMRINTRLTNVIGDIVWVQMENMAHLLVALKSFGPDRFRVADILAGDDDTKRKALFSKSDQNSIIYEIINRKDEQRSRGDVNPIHDMRTLFHALDPSLEVIVELIQHWILWDLPDAAALFNFEQQMKRIHFLRSIEIPEDLKEKYRAALHKGAQQPFSDAEIIKLELKRLSVIAHHFLARRDEEESYMMIIRRDEEAGSASDRQIQKLADRMKAFESIKSGGGFVESHVAEKYAAILDCGPEDVTAERILDYEKRSLAEEKQQLRSYLDDDRMLGQPYDYKKMQARDVEERLAKETELCEEYIKVNSPPPVEEPAKEVGEIA